MATQIPLADVVGVGLNATDTLLQLPRFPTLDSKMEVLSPQVLPGGQVASAMAACQSWGLRARYVGKVGDDAAAQFQRDQLAAAGVETHWIVVPDCRSQMAFILVDQISGERTILWQRDPRLAVRPAELDRDWVIRARLLHVDGHDAMAAATAANWAREAGIPVTADIDNLYAGVEDLLQNVDYLLASSEFPRRLTGVADYCRSLPRIQEKYGCRVSGVTLGRDGALAWNGTQFFYSPAYRVKTVDTTGAGDIFHGGFIYALLQGRPLQWQLEFSCAAAALNCTALGARGGIRPIEEIERLMQDGPRYEPRFELSRLGILEPRT